MAAKKNKILKLPSIQRLPNYLYLVKELQEKGAEVVSTTYLAEKIKSESIVVRKDLAITGILGQPGVGYKVKDLIAAIEDFLGWNNTSDAFVIGAGNLGAALLGYQGFSEHGLNIIAGFDTDPAKIGTQIAGKQIFSMDDLTYMAERMKVKLAVLCVPSEYGQEAANRMVEAGIKAIWNFTPLNLVLPDNVVAQRQDLASGLAVLSIKLSKLLKEEQADS